MNAYFNFNKNSSVEVKIVIPFSYILKLKFLNLKIEMTSFIIKNF